MFESCESERDRGALSDIANYFEVSMQSMSEGQTARVVANDRFAGYRW